MNQSLLLDMEFSKKIELLLIKKDIKNLEHKLFDFSNILLDYDFIPESLFEWYITLFDREEFFNSEASSYIIFIIIDNWDHFSDVQKDELLLLLTNVYSKLNDKMSLFNISLILGEKFCNTHSFMALQRLKNTDNELARAYIPHGFVHIVSDSNDEKLSISALRELINMMNDSSKLVHSEVIEAINNIREFIKNQDNKHKNSIGQILQEEVF